MTQALSKPVQLRDAQDGTCLAVENLEAKVSVDGPLARTELRVAFTNDLGRAVEGDLVFPLPPFAALRALHVQVGARRIEGRIRARERANAEYRHAVEAGHTAALGESEGEDLARVKVAPIAGGEKVVVAMTLEHALAPIGDGHRLVVPLTYMPRFVEDDAPLKDTERAALARPRPITLAARARVDVEVRHAGGDAPQLRATSHAMTITPAARATSARLEGAPLDRDLHLEILDRRAGEAALWVRHDAAVGADGNKAVTAVAIVPPAFAEEGETVPRTVTFVVDRSGSMDGGPMNAAIRAVRGALRALGPDDRFNVVAFDDTLEALASRPVAFDQTTLRAADAFVSALTARGGTQAQMAISAALDDVQSRAQTVALTQAPPPDGAHRLRLVVFMTDGDVAGAEGVLKTAQAKLEGTRIHVVGIGDAVNHAMLAELARLGGGTYTPVSTGEDLERALARLKNAMNAPVWTNVRVSLEAHGGRRVPIALEPRGPLDLFAGEPLLVAWPGAAVRGERLVVEARRAGGAEVVLRAPLDADAPEAASPLASTAWALLRNRRLSYRFDPADDAALEGLGVAFGLVNRATALVGVDPEKREVAIDASVPVVLPLPRSAAAHGAQVTRCGAAPGGAPMMRAMAMQPVYACALPAQEHQAPAKPSFGARLAKLASSLVGSPSAAAEDTGQHAPLSDDAPVLAEVDDADDDEAKLRALLLRQGADGLFDGDVGVTLAAVAALALHGHTAREGLFRSELGRTLRAVRGTSENDRAVARVVVALLTLSVGDLSVARAKVRAELAAASPTWRASRAAAEIARSFGL